MKTTNLIGMFTAAVSLCLAAVAPAFATPIDLTICYTVTASGSNGNAPGIANDFGSLVSGKDCLNMNGLKLGPDGTDTLFTASPAGSSGLALGKTDSESLSVTFFVSDLDSGANTPINGAPTVTGTFTANYTLPELPCAYSDGAPSAGGESDCIVWSSTNNPMQFALTGTDGGTYLDITLNNAVDWNITPTVTFTLTKTPLQQVPEPGTLALLGIAVAGFAASRRRKLN
jgi:hypothetical protein